MNTTSHITIAEPKSQVVVQTITRAAGKTFIQAFVSGLALTFTPWLLEIAEALSNGESVTMDDLNLGGKLILSAVVGAVASLISFGMNYFGAKTLPAGSTVHADAQ